MFQSAALVAATMTTGLIAGLWLQLFRHARSEPG